MLYGRLVGLDKPVSRAIVGCELEDGAEVWDRFIALGGNGFDTSHVWRDGAGERALGAWLASRGVGASAVVIIKGAHPPCCDPQSVVRELTESLERIGLRAADLYLLHRDNPDVPVGEFVDVLNQLCDQGLISTFGASNFTAQRFREANDYAFRHRKRPFRMLSNHFSLATMEAPIAPGALSAMDPTTRAFMGQSHTPLLAWSSLARGYFHERTPTERPGRVDRAERFFDSPENRLRRRRAAELGSLRGLTAAQIATAYVLNQPFPSFAVMGPRTAGQVDDCLAGVGVELTPAELAWLELARPER
jgi:aryl-alcohol dehydrogenase-like predicted oxidoreductase